MKILIAEDDPLTRTVLIRVLQELNHEPVAASHGKEAWSYYRRERFPVVITDWMMPEMDGIELTKKIRQSRTSAYTWMIMLTSRDYTRHYAYSVASGIDDYLTKPLNRELLRVRLHVAERVTEMSNRLRQLEAALPICVTCKNVKESGNQWQHVEQYLAMYTGAEITHVQCPDCTYKDSLLPELQQLKRSVRFQAPTGQSALERASIIDPTWLTYLSQYDLQQAPGFLQELVDDFTQAVGGISELLKTLPGKRRLTQKEQTQLALFRTRSTFLGAFRLAALLAPRHLRKIMQPGPERRESYKQLEQELGRVVDELTRMGALETADELQSILPP